MVYPYGLWVLMFMHSFLLFSALLVTNFDDCIVFFVGCVLISLSLRFGTPSRLSSLEESIKAY